MDDEMRKFEPPPKIDGAPVGPVLGSEMLMQGELWVTMRPTNSYDGRLWEFSLTSGRTIQVRGADQELHR